ncbi:uncharacterized protein SETTUDRAFT_158196 [Exserohilum turcica Et28A]|uniref:Copper transport protein n=1 Tax=Exserohilum turcicum (strain 28A) TaxID=671987 RepID=R0J133_EXST2|nr:uncharacterized protein SETTUDRAFT_158196 [Exserohilum turcica Et28A]EOA90635.1 hypothetical protein SETTUDRAFT_158196 [Exserohilum turcica Et28A]
MLMTFFTSSRTPLFSTSWTPTTSGQYAGTCIFLIALAAVFRALVAIRFNLFAVLERVKGRRGVVSAVGNRGSAGLEGEGGEGKQGRRGRTAEWRPWRADEAVWIASFDVVIAGVSYLLMIAVMTMNVGYFMSVLAGVFLGSLAFGRFMAKAAAH